MLGFLVCSSGALLSACAASHGSSTSHPPDASNPPSDAQLAPDPLQRDASPVLGHQADAGALTLRLEASSSLLCGGECTTLRAVVQGGRPPYVWHWSHTIPGERSAGESGPHTVCPLETTSYSVEVHDTASSDLEFGQTALHASAQTTLRVRPSCEVSSHDAGSPDAELPIAAPLPACTIRIPLSIHAGDGAWMPGSANMDAAGNLYLGATLVGETQIGSGPRLTAGIHRPRLLVAKYDPTCELQWLRLLGDERESSSFGSMEVDLAGRVAVARSYFLEHPTQVPVYTTEVVVLDAQGSELWRYDAKNGPLAAGAEMHGLAWGRDGSLAVFGLWEHCARHESTGACVAKLSADGKLLFARFIGGAAGAAVALDDDGNLLATGLSNHIGVRVPGLVATIPDSPVSYLVKFDAVGTPAWIATSAVRNSESYNHVQGFVSALQDRSMLAVWDQIRDDLTLRATYAWRVTSGGVLRSLLTLNAANEAYLGTPPVFGAARSGELFTAMYLEPDASGTSGRTQGLTRIVVWHADGTSARQIDLPEARETKVYSIHVSPQGQAILVSGEMSYDQAIATQSALVIRRLAAQ